MAEGATLIYQPGVLEPQPSISSPERLRDLARRIQRIAQAPESALTHWTGGLPWSWRRPWRTWTGSPRPARPSRPSPQPWSSSARIAPGRATSQLGPIAHRPCNLQSPGFKMTSEPGESEGEFRSRLQLAARERRDEASNKLRAKYAAKTATLQQQLLRAEQAVEREQERQRTARCRRRSRSVPPCSALSPDARWRAAARWVEPLRPCAMEPTMDEQGDINARKNPLPPSSRSRRIWRLSSRRRSRPWKPR